MGSLQWEVSALGFGCMRLPRTRFLTSINERAAIDIIRYGIDRGVNYLDTAWIYPQSEVVIGKALADGYRSKVRIATKLPMILVRKADDFDKYLDAQLQRLGTDCIDFYLFHMLNISNFAKLKNLSLIDKMEKARDAGKIRHIGFSFHDTLPVFKEIIDYYPWEMTQIQYNYMDTALQATTEGLEYAHKKGIAVVIMEPLRGGQLANPPKEALDIIKQSPVNRSPVDWALQFLWNRPEVACVLSGMGNRKMVEENCTSADKSGVDTLTREEQDTINRIANIYRKKIIVPCTSCRYCMPCPVGVNIPQNFALLNNKSLSNSGKLMSRFIQWLVIGNYRKLAGKDVRHPHDNGKASRCIKCNGCLPKCPQKIAIPIELDKVIAVFERGKSVASVQKA